MEITQSTLKSVLHYDSDTGIFSRMKRPREHFNVSRQAIGIINAGSTWNEAGQRETP